MGKRDKRDLFIAYWKMLGDNTPYETELVALKPRKFRFDIAFVEHKVAIEIDGGVWTGGRHTRGKGYTSDCVKNNLAIERGWVMLRYTPQMLEDDPVSAINQVKKILSDRSD